MRTHRGVNAIPLVPLAAAGFGTVVAQAVLLREIIVVCQGTELTVGFAMAAWLAAGAAGSRAAAALRGRFAAGGFPAALLALASLPVPALLAVRGFKWAAGYLPGQAMSLGHAALLSAVAMIPTGVAAGAAYACGVHWLEQRDIPRPAGSGYWAEAIGFMAGGAAFTAGTPLLPAIGAVALSSLATAVAAVLTGARRRTRIASLIAGTALAGVASAGPALERATARWLLPGSTIVSSTESNYGRIVAAVAGGQTTVYHNGWPVASLPAAPTVEQQEMVALGLLHADHPRRVLLVGGAGLLPQLLAQDVGSVTYAEIDPLLIRIIGPETAGRATLTTAQVDARRYIETSEERFDVIFVGIPYAANLSANRYYTLEFMAAARRRLTDGGVLVYGLPGAETARDRNKEALGATVAATLASVFEHHAVIRGVEDVMIGRKRSPVPADSVIVNRFAARGLLMASLTSESLRHRLSLGEGLATDQTTGAVNRDRRPAALVDGLLLWQAVLSPPTVRIYRLLSRIHPLWWLLAAAAIPWRRRKPEGTAFSAGAAAMGLQLLCLWGLQIRNGELYQWLATANALFMAGTVVGALLAAHVEPAAGRAIVIVDAVFCAWAAVFLLVNAAAPVAGWLYLLGSAITGSLLGAEFSLLAAKARPGEGRAAGPLYAADMLGGALAALWIGTLAMPAWGMLASAGAVVGMKLVSLPWWVSRRSDRAPA